MKEYLEVTSTREFAHGLLADPILRMAVNAVLEKAPRVEMSEATRLDVASPATAGMVSWLRDKAARGCNIDWSRMLNRAADRMELLDRVNRWIPAGKPPEDGTVVLVTDGRYVDSAIYDAETDGFDVDHAFVDPGEITGWKPLADLLEFSYG